MANKKGGKKYKRNKKTSYVTKFPKKELEFQEYAYVMSMDGGQHCKLLLPDGLEYKGVMRGSLKKKHIFIKRNGFILVEKRDFQESKVDITFQYADEQIDELKDDIDFKKLKLLVDKKNNRYTDNEDNLQDDTKVNEEESEEEEDFYSMMNRITTEQIDLDDI